MKTILISPVHFYIYQTLAVPRLIAYLKSKGHDVLQKVIDTEVYTFLFSPEEMRKTFSKIKENKSSLLANNNDQDGKQQIEQKIAYFLKICALGMPEPEINDRFDWMLKNEEKIIAVIYEAQRSMDEHFTTSGKEEFRNNYKK